MVDCRSVQDMLAAHVLVKVQLNGNASGSEQVAMQLVSGCQASLVEIRGHTILLAKGETV